MSHITRETLINNYFNFYSNNKERKNELIEEMLISLDEASKKGLNEINKDINECDYKLIISDNYDYIQKKIQKKGLYIKVYTTAAGGIPNEKKYYGCIVGFDISYRKNMNSSTLLFSSCI